MEPKPGQPEQNREIALAEACANLRQDLQVLLPDDLTMVINLRQRDRLSSVPEDQEEDILIDTKGNSNDILSYLKGEPFQVCRQETKPGGSSLIYVKMI